MTQTIYLLDGNDAYELELDSETKTIRGIWRYAGNRPGQPQFVQYSWLDETLQQRIDDKVLRTADDLPPNGL